MITKKIRKRILSQIESADQDGMEQIARKLLLIVQGGQEDLGVLAQTFFRQAVRNGD